MLLRFHRNTRYSDFTLPSMADRYFSQLPITASEVVLADNEAHHLAHVLRAKPGLEVTLFDGGGAEFAARVREVKRDRVTLDVLARRDISRESPWRLTLAVALPKGDRQKWLVEKLVELGAARLIPLVTARAVSQPVAAALDRLRRGVIEASKQCGRNRLMEIAEPRDWQSLLAESGAESPRWFAHPGPGAAPVALPTTTSALTCAVGPEGGFTEAEARAALAAGWTPVELGPRILRVETAAAALAANLLTPLAVGPAEAT